MQNKKKYYENLSDTLIEQFNKRGIEAYYCINSEDALAKAERFLTPECTVSFGGSMTLSQIGLLDLLKVSDYILYDRTAAKTPKEKTALYQNIVACDYYFMSSNAITMDGQLINIDGFGNRVACLASGPKNVIIIAGMNKVTPDIDSAIKRVQNIAAPSNALRLSCNTPCAENGVCSNCLDDDCLCAQIMITRKSKINGRIKVILVGEELGY